MKYRIALWAVAGLVVAAGWGLYAVATFPSPINPATPVVWNLALITQPIAFASWRLHFPVSIYVVLLANAATYAMVGLIIEILRRQLHHAT
jgi:hypothetical protein